MSDAELLAALGMPAPAAPPAPPRREAPARAPSQPRGLRNNNPGNIEDGEFARSLPGYAGSDGRFAIFDTPEAGTQAKTRLLGSYIQRGFDTPAKIINRWAPPSDNNPTADYAAYVAQRVGLGVNDRVTPDQIPALAQAIAEFENGQTQGEDVQFTAAPMPPHGGDVTSLSDEALMAALQGVDVPSGEPGVLVWNDLTPEQQMAIQPGDRVRLPNGEVVTAAGSPYANPDAARTGESAGGNLYTEVPGLATGIEALSTAYIEQIPFLDEAVTAARAARDGIGYSEARDQYRRAQDSLNQTNRGERVAGGLLGFGATLAAPVGGARFVAKGASRLDRLGRAGMVGAGAGSLYGAGAADGGVEERAGGAATGGLLGYAGGVAGQEIVQALPRVASGLSEAGARIQRGFGIEPKAAEVTPAATDAALDYVRRVVRDSGAEGLLREAPAGKPLTAAEAIGPAGVTQVAALSRRAGRTAEAAQGQLGARAQEQGARVVQDFADLTGLDPAGSADLIENLATAGRRIAAPLYDRAYSRSVQPTPIIEDILTRPTGRAALRRAYQIARDEGRNPEELGLFVMDAADGMRTGPSAVTRDAETLADLDALRAGTRTQGAGRGQSLLEFVARNGGVKDTGGELQAVGAGLWHREGSWRSRVVRDDGLDIEAMAQRAYEAGYFPEIAEATMEGAENMQRVTPRDMIDAIADELRGVRRFARQTNGDPRDLRVARRAALDERLMREGIDLQKVSNEEALRRLRDADDAEARIMAQLSGDGPDAPDVTIVQGAVPTFQTLDYIKRGMDSLLEGYRDSTTRRLNLDDRGRAVLGNVTRYRRELERLNPDYREALRAGGDPLRLEDAFRRSERLFSTGVSERDFARAIEGMGEADRRALAAGLADKLYREAQSGKLTTRRLNQLDVPAMRGKLARVIGSDNADDFIRRIRVEIEMARSGGRMAPGTNSITSEVQEAIRDQDGGVGLLSDLSRNIEESGVWGGATRTAAQALSAPVAGFIRGAQSPAPVPVRDEIGRLLLMSPEELRGLLSEAPRRPVPRGSTRGALAGGLLAPRPLTPAGER